MATHFTTGRVSAATKRSAQVHSRNKSASLGKRRGSHGASSKKSEKTEKAASQQHSLYDDDPAMATSFLQYCTICDKQIVVPSNSVLYCSEHCRKQDTSTRRYPLSHRPPPPLQSLSSYSSDDLSFPDIVPLRSPTLPSNRSSCAFSETSQDDNTPYLSGEYESDLSSTRKHSSTSDLSMRPPYTRTSTSYSHSAAPTPSLSHTPASSISYSMPYTPYTPATRPLLPRGNPHNSAYSSYSGRYTDLVTPCTYATAPSSPSRSFGYQLKTPPLSTTSTPNASGEILYEKSPVPEVVSASGSLKQLFKAAVSHRS